MLRFLTLFLAGSFVQGPSASETIRRPAEPGNILVYKRMAVVDPVKPIPFSGSLRGAKLAFQTKGSEDASFVLHDQATNKDLWPARRMWKYTGNCPHVAGYQWAGGNWGPCLYRMDLFGQDSMLWRRLQEAPQGTEFSLDCSKPHGPKTTFQVRNLVLYRGDDVTPPEAPGGLATQAADDGVRLSWSPAADNVGVAWYVISRAMGKGQFFKIAQKGETEYTDKPSAAEAYRYRVLAVDYERNVGPWSKEVSVQAGKGFAQPGPSLLVSDKVLVPSHGRIMSNPARAIDALVARLNQCFEEYLAVNVLRGMFPDFANYVDYSRKDYLPLFKSVRKMGNGRMSCKGPLYRAQPLPACVCHREPTSWVLKSKDGPALLVDCGRSIEKELQGMVQKGEIMTSASAKLLTRKLAI